MENVKIDLLMTRFSGMVPEDTYVLIYKALEELPEERSAFIYTLNLKSPNVSFGLNLLGFIGLAGMDRFYLGNVGIGLLKFLTLGGYFIWTIYDVFMLRKKVKVQNFNKLMSRLVKKTYVDEYWQNQF